MTQETILLKYITEWIASFKAYDVKQSTHDRLLTSVNALAEYPIASMPIAEITTRDIQQYVNQLTEHGYRLSTIKKQMRIVTAPLRQAAAFHEIPADPSVGVRLPSLSRVKKAPKAIDAYSPEEQERLRKELCTGMFRGYPAILLMLETGLRAGETLALRWSDVDLDHRRLHVGATVVRLANRKCSYVQDSAKSVSSERTIPLTDEAMDILTGQKEKQSSEWVFTNEDGDRLSYEALRGQTRRACEQADVEYRGEHVFRHTFATNCYHKGIDVKVLSKLLGHSEVNITYNIYVHLYGDGFDELYEALVEHHGCR